MRRAGWRRVILRVLCAAVLGFIVLPIVIVVPISFSSASYLTFPPPGFSLQWYANYFGRHEWTDPTLRSLRLGVTTSLIATAVGTVAAFGLVRGRWRRAQTVLYGLFLAPLITPVMVFAVAVYFLFSRVGLVGSFWGLVLAHTVLAIPFVIVTVSASLMSLDTSFERAAMSLGANQLRTFWYVTLPLIHPGILAAALFAFLTSFDELIVALFLSGARSPTLPFQMWMSIREEIDPTLPAISTLLIALAAGLVFAAQLIRQSVRRSRGLPRDWSSFDS